MALQQSLKASVTRGPQSWNFIYALLGFALTIWGTLVAMTPIIFPINWLVFAIGSAIIWYLLVFCGPVQNKIIGWKNSYESKPR